MEYGLRRYEATQRLLWFLFFLACLGAAYLMTPARLPEPPSGSPAFRTIQPDVLKSLTFWFNLYWIRMEPFGRVMLFVIWALSLFLGGRLLGLIVQYLGQFLVKSLLNTHLGSHASPQRNHPTPPAALLLKRTENILLQCLFHPFRRLRVLLTNPGMTLSSGSLSEKERRLAEADWEILWSSWSSFRWLLWLLPLAGGVQSVTLLVQYLQPVLFGQSDILKSALKDFQELFGLVFIGLLPLLQVVFLAIVFSLGAGLLKRLEGFYLSGVDALFYDRFLTRVPFQSSDTPILLETLQKNFQEIHSRLKSLEECIVPSKESESRKRY